MKEITFLKQNSEKWETFETMITTKGASDPDLMADLFIQLTDDLSYSRTHYPKSKTTQYLNAVAARVHQEIYKNKKEKRSRISHFWKYELPFLFRNSHKQLLWSFIIFAVGFLIAVLSTKYDTTFLRLVVGDDYVNETLNNINNHDSLAIYKSDTQINMFIRITVNNIRVSFVAYALGVLASFGTAWIIFTNGLMVGAFQFFFLSRGLLLKSALVIWIHGTLEISVIIIAGCAGLTMGNSILFPGTYSRGVSFVKGAKQGAKIVIGTMPIFIIAGFLESFITRYTDMPVWLSASIILSSFTFIVWYFIIYPIRLNNKAMHIAI